MIQVKQTGNANQVEITQVKANSQETITTLSNTDENDNTQIIITNDDASIAIVNQQGSNNKIVITQTTR